MRATIGAVLAVMLAAGVALSGEGAANKGRVVAVSPPGGQAVLYLPALHDPARTWPLLVYLPGRAETAEEALAPWRKMADACGIVLAVPVAPQPEPGRGYPDLIVLGMVRAAVQSANCDPERAALVGTGDGGYGASALAVSYPRLVRAVVVIGSAPATVETAPALLARMPARLVLAGDPKNLEKARAWQKARPGEAVTVVELKGAEGALGAAGVKQVLTWLGEGVDLVFGGQQPPKPPPAKLDPKAAAARLAEADKLAAGGAEAGAYLLRLRAARLDPASAAARLALARTCLAGGRLEESLDWARAAAALDAKSPEKSPEPHLAAGRALLRQGRAAEALAELKAAGEPGAAAAAALQKRLGAFKPGGVESARESFRKAVEALAAGDYAAAAKAARAAERAAPAEAACRALAVYAAFNAEGLAAARKELDEYLALLPDDPQITRLAAALDATARTDYAREKLPAKADAPVGQVLPAGPGAGLLAALAAKAGLGTEEEKLSAALAGAGANRDVRAGLPLLASRGLAVQVGRGSLDDLREKLAAGAAVMVQLPQGELAGLRDNERYTAGLLRLAVGYDDAAKCIILRDYGARKSLAIPYGLFELLWSRLDNWWLALAPADKRPAGKPGDLTALELAVGKALGGDLDGALKDLGPVGDSTVADYPRRLALARGMVLWRMGQLEEARKDFTPLADGAAEFAVQANLALGAIEEQAGGPMPGRLDKALARYRRAWELDPGTEPATLSVAFALVKRSRPEDLAEAREILEDYLRLQPASLPALMLRYSF